MPSRAVHCLGLTSWLSLVARSKTSHDAPPFCLCCGRAVTNLAVELPVRRKIDGQYYYQQQDIGIPALGLSLLSTGRSKGNLESG
jgi:hypothetical protein